jgi:asparagine synthase (glutamine-hydrolysing)
MCRIYGYAGAGFDPSMITNARDAQMRGGPDEQQIVQGRSWALGCNRLAIQDPVTGRQPFSNESNTIHAVFNGEIYNFRSVRTELRRCGVDIEGDSDGDVIVPYYERYGDAFIDRLDGMFAIAIIDLRRGCTLKLFCDPLAIKSLHYAVVNDGVAFASELHALREIIDFDPEVEPSAINEYLNLQCIPLGSSWLKGTTSLRPGEQFRRDHNGITAVLTRESPAVPNESQESHRVRLDGPDQLRRILDAEIDHMTLQPSPIAVQISGGIDSAVLTSLLAKRRSDVVGFHVTHEGVHESDELKYAREAAAYAGVPLQITEVCESELPDLVMEIVQALGAPNATAHSVSAYALFRDISHNDLRVCFSGDGADEQFGGYRRYWTALAASSETWAAGYLDRLSLVEHAQLSYLYTPDYRAFLRTAGDSRCRHLDVLNRRPGSRLERMLAFDREIKLPSLNLSKIDHLSMANAVECRIPYCQRAVTAFARTSPDEFKIARSARKRVLYDMATSLVPPLVLHRAKQPFTFPTSAFLRPGHALWDFARDVLARPVLCTSSYLRRDVIDALMTGHENGAANSRVVWGLLMLELSMAAV